MKTEYIIYIVAFVLIVFAFYTGYVSGKNKFSISKK